VTANPALAAIDWMTVPSWTNSGLFCTISDTGIGVFSPLAFTRAFAWAMFCAGQGTLTAHGLLGGIGVQPGVYSPLNATLLI
jgi:hypothetical protein